MVEMTIQLPDTLASELASVEDRLPEVLAYGLGQLSPVPNQVYRDVLNFLISQPSPQELAQFAPKPEIQAHVSTLLEKNRAGMLTAVEQSELAEYDRINHLVTMFKARTLNYLKQQP
ncbi:MAG: hypothetical protein H6668_23195 [Ardenticatenaceae bacterium]|nr:hypothetical protein [Ardenticatenaceae bacterium]